MSAIEFTPEELELRSRAFASKLKTPRQTVQELVRAIASAHGVTVRDMMGQRRLHHLVMARAELYRTLRAPPWLWSTPAIGRLVHRDHTTIVMACKRLPGPPRKLTRGETTSARHRPPVQSVEQQQAQARAVVADEPWLRGDGR